MRSWQRFLLGGLFLAAIAVAGIALNFTLLGLARDENEPVGKLSPRAVFTGGPAATTPVTTTPTTTTPGSDDGSPPGSDDTPGPGPGPGDSDSDSDSDD